LSREERTGGSYSSGTSRCKCVSRYDRRVIYERLGEKEGGYVLGKLALFDYLFYYLLCALIRHVNAYEGDQEKGYLRACQTKAISTRTKFSRLLGRMNAGKLPPSPFPPPDIMYQSADPMGAAFPSSVFRIYAV
jgi:hypothetical protein